MKGRNKHEYVLSNSERKYNGHILNLRVDQVRFPNNKVFVREVVEHAGAVGTVPLSSDGKVVMVKQYRHPIADFLLEIPAGLLNADESPLECAVRELEEETGCTSEYTVKLAEFFTTPGYSNEKFYLYLATDVKETEAKPEDDEFLETVKIDLVKALNLIDEGKIQDAKTIIGLCLAFRHIAKQKARK